MILSTLAVAVLTLNNEIVELFTAPPPVPYLACHAPATTSLNSSAVIVVALAHQTLGSHPYQFEEL